MNKFFVLREQLAAIADAIRGRTGKSNNLKFPNDFVTEINNIPYGPDEEITKLIEGEITTITNNASSIRSQAFINCESLTAVNFPKCINIGKSAFIRCESLTSVNFPVCTNIDIQAFSDCTSLTSVNFPKCIDIGANAFEGCRSLTSVSFPQCINIFYQAFRYCTSLTYVNLPMCQMIYSSAFYNCYKLLSLYLGNSFVVSLRDIYAFSNTPIIGYTEQTGGVYGSIFVPTSLVEAYKSAKYWSRFADRITAIPE